MRVYILFRNDERNTEIYGIYQDKHTANIIKEIGNRYSLNPYWVECFDVIADNNIGEIILDVLELLPDMIWKI